MCPPIRVNRAEYKPVPRRAGLKFVPIEKPPYGWSGDAIDGAVYTLLVAGLVRQRRKRASVDHVMDRRFARPALGRTHYGNGRSAGCSEADTEAGIVFQRQW